MANFNGNTPFSNSLSDLQNVWMQQYSQYMKNQQSPNILDEINKEVSSLSTDEQNLLSQLQEYQMAKQAYEAGFMSFIGLKFSQEYIASQDGKAAADNLLQVIRRSKSQIQAQIRAKEEKVNTLLELMEKDPEMKKRFNELMLNKTNSE